MVLSRPGAPQPIAWSAIERIERAQRRWGPGAGVGGALGFWGGLTVGAIAGWLVGEASKAMHATWVGIAMGGAAVGAYAMGADEQWVEVPIANR